MPGSAAEVCIHTYELPVADSYFLGYGPGVKRFNSFLNFWEGFKLYGVDHVLCIFFIISGWGRGVASCSLGSEGSGENALLASCCLLIELVPRRNLVDVMEVGLQMSSNDTHIYYRLTIYYHLSLVTVFDKVASPSMNIQNF